MSAIHYFQRYSSSEDTVTNNTLQLFARIYDHSPNRLSALLSEITGEQIEVGIEIRQQEKAGASRPDGIIGQRSFKVIVETKVDEAVRLNQLTSHATQFDGEAQQILLLISKQAVDESRNRELARHVQEQAPDVLFRCTTFESVCTALSELFQEYETEITSIVEDYWQYCNDTGLFDQSKSLMRVVPCSVSIDLNGEYGIYYHRNDRGYTKHAYLGIYANKAVRYIWKIASVFDVEFDGQTIERTLIQGEDTDRFDERLKCIIQESRTHCDYQVARGHRFFCGEPVETNYVKGSNGGIQGARFFNLADLLGDFNSVEEAAARLRTMTWQ